MINQTPNRVNDLMGSKQANIYKSQKHSSSQNQFKSNRNTISNATRDSQGKFSSINNYTT